MKIVVLATAESFAMRGPRLLVHAPGKLCCRFRVQGGYHKLAFAAQMSAASWSFRSFAFMTAIFIGCTLLQFGHHTFGNALVSSSIRTSAPSPPPRYRSRIHYAGPRRVFVRSRRLAVYTFLSLRAWRIVLERGRFPLSTLLR
jgi:hypothetical protein